MNRILSIATALLALGVAALFAAGNNAVSYPDRYRDWTHVKSMVIQAGHPLFESFGGIHHIYANDKALAALEAGGKQYPDGSVFVFDLLDATATGGAVVEGKRKIVGVMEKNAQRFAATGGWGFEGFKADTRERVVADAGASCWTCHQSQTKTDGTFTTWRP
ncbi:MAG: cytochrome P460 family protein [Acidobacteriota bacterium]